MIRLFIIFVFSLFLLFSGCGKKEQQKNIEQEQTVSDTTVFDITEEDVDSTYINDEDLQ
jgi:hypothetical protein